MKKMYHGKMTEKDCEEKLLRLSKRLGLSQSSIAWKETSSSLCDSSVILEIQIGTTVLCKYSSSGNSQQDNLVLLTLWLEDCVRNIERRIETLREAFFGVGGKELQGSLGVYGKVRENRYQGEKSITEATTLIENSLLRLGLSLQDIKLEWFADGKAQLFLRLQGGRVVKKESYLQDNAIQNVVALGLWLQCKAKNWERGMEPHFHRLFEANLLPERSVA